MQALRCAPELSWLPQLRPPPDPEPPYRRLLLLVSVWLIVISSLTHCLLPNSMKIDKPAASRGPASINRAPGAPSCDQVDDKSLQLKLDAEAPVDDTFQGVNLSSFMDREFFVENISQVGRRCSGDGNDPPDADDEPFCGFNTPADDVDSIFEGKDKRC